MTDVAPLPGQVPLRERLLDLGPMAALGLVLAMLWAFVSWFAWLYRDELRRDHDRDLSSLANAAASQTEEVLREAEISLRTVDLWLRTRGTTHPLDDAPLVQMVETLHTSTRSMIEIVLSDSQGWLYRIPSPSGQAFHQLKDQPFVELLSRPESEGFQLGRAFRFSEGSPLRLPLAMRLSPPQGGMSMVVVLVNLDRLQQLQSLYVRGTEGSVAMFSREGEVLSRIPDLPGFVGQRVYASRPDLRADLAPQSGVFRSEHSPADGQPRTAAFETITDFGVKLILAEGESKALSKHRSQRLAVLALAAVLSLAAMLTTLVLVRQHRSLRERDAALQATSDASPLGLFRADGTGRLVWTNETYLRLHGLAAEEADWGWLLLMPEATRTDFKARWQSACAEGRALDLLHPLQRRDGVQLLVALRTAPLRVNGKTVGLAGTVADITEQANAQRERLRSEAVMRAVAKTAPVLIAVLDTEQRYVYFNRRYAEHFGTRFEAWRGRHIRELIGEEQYVASLPAIEAALLGQQKAIETSYDDRPALLILDVHYSPLRLDDGEIAGAICIARDVTAARQEEARLRHASQTDTLTQLLNRNGFHLAADEKLASARQHNHLLALLYLDLDHFKPVNDQYGHPMGDALLRAVAGRIRHALRPNDLAARLGGDEFAVLLSSLHGPEDAELVAAKLVQALATPFMIDHHELHIGCSVGFCVAWGSQADLEAMVAQADARLYEAKRGGRGTWRGGLLEDSPLSGPAPA